jgi:rhamnose transport system permease protein
MTGRYRRELSVAIAFALLLAALALPAMSGKPSFFQSSEPRNILVQCAPVLLAAVGMTLIILSRNIDISIGSQFSLCAVAAGLLAQAGVPMPLVALGTLLIGAGLGALNGALVAGLGLPSIVVTLATMVILREGLRWWREGEFVRDLPPDFQWFGLGQDAGQWLIVGLALGVFIAGAWGLRYLAAGRAVYATGSDPEAARLVGIRPRRVVFTVFAVMGGVTGLAALLSAVQLPQVDPRSGEGLELRVIATVVVGGVAISGGRGTLAGVLLGVALLGTVRSALVFLGAQPYWEKAIQGGIILLAVALDALNLRRRKDAGTHLGTP